MHHFAEEETLDQFVDRIVLIIELHGTEDGHKYDGMVVAEERE